MRRLISAAVAAVLQLFTSTSSADWSSNLEVGKRYSDIVDVGHVGARKQVVLPSNPGDWLMLGSSTKSDRLVSAASTTVAVDAKFGNMLLVNTNSQHNALVMLTIQASVISISGGVIPDVCPEQKATVFQDLYPSWTSHRKPKCLTITRLDEASLPEFERSAIASHGLKLPNGQLIRVSMATSDNRYGTLSLAFTSAVPVGEEATYIESLKKWGHQYITSQLEDSLSRSLWEAPFKDPYPITVTGANPTATAPVTQPAGAQPAPSSDDVFSMLEKLKSLHEQGILTDQEFNSKKAELLKRL